MFSQCDKSCGGGKMFKTRTKVVTEKHGGYCDNLAKVVKDCNTHHCPGKLQNRLFDIKVIRLVIIKMEVQGKTKKTLVSISETSYFHYMIFFEFIEAFGTFFQHFVIK